MPKEQPERPQHNPKITVDDSQNKEKNQDSSTRVNSSKILYKGRRITAGFKCDEKLWKEALTVFKREFGSVCRPMEAIIAAVLGVIPLKVNSSKTITIEKIVIERNLRPRRYAVPKGRPKGNRFWSFGRHYEMGEDGEPHETNHYDPNIGWYYDPDYEGR